MRRLPRHRRIQSGDSPSDDLIDEVVFGQRPAGAPQRAIAPTGGLEVVDRIVRPLKAEDLPMVMAATRDNQIRPLAKIRETHHALARAIARGMSDVEASVNPVETPQKTLVELGRKSSNCRRPALRYFTAYTRRV